MLLTMVALVGATAGFELRAQIVRQHFLQVQLVAQGTGPVLVTPRTTLGCYVNVEVQNAAGVAVGHLGPRATCSSPDASDFEEFVDSEDFGAQLFGTEIDLSKPHRFRIGPQEADLETGREYRLVVSYVNGDFESLGERSKAAVRRRHPGSKAPTLSLRAQPISYRRQP